MATDARLPIVSLGRNYWPGKWMNRQQLLSRLGARGWPIVYSNGPLNIWNRTAPEWHDARWLSRTVEQDGVKVDYPGRLMCRWPRLYSWDKFALRRHVNRLKKVLGLQSSKFIVLVFDPYFWPHIDLLAPKFLAYHAYDAFSLMPGWNSKLAEFEKKIVESADLVTASTRGVIRELPGDGPTRAKELLNGADTDRVLKATLEPCPADLAAIPSPRVGYIGRINDKVDFGLVAELSNKRPDWNWVFVGPVSGHQAKAELERISPRKKFSNVHYLGPKSSWEAAIYAYHMDVNIICYQLNIADWAKTGNPLKLYEYLGTGKPVVSSDLEMVRPFESVVAIASGVHEWISALESAIQTDSESQREQRREVARRNNWNYRVDKLESWLFEIVEAQSAC